MKILILDMDGTVRIKKGGKSGELESGFIEFPEDQEIILGAKNAIETYFNKGWLIIGASNQGGVEAKKKTLESCFQEQSFTLQLEPRVEMILFCPDYEGKKLGVVSLENCELRFPKRYPSFRKPAPGMANYILDLYEANPKDCLFVGDRLEDHTCAMLAEIPFLWAKDWWEE